MVNQSSVIMLCGFLPDPGFGFVRYFGFSVVQSKCLMKCLLNGTLVWFHCFDYIAYTYKVMRIKYRTPSLYCMICMLILKCIS
ncbi:hypothetical protein Hdeb2414_s0003g00097001 [Helianthus debilis subsp. tardiflorus]